MKRHSKKLIIASLVTPWVVVPVTALYSLWYLVSWLGKPLPSPDVTLIFPHPFKPWESIFLYSLYGVPAAYVSLLLIGLPCYFVARRLNRLSFTTTMLAAILTCIPAAAFFGKGSNFWSMYGFLLLFGIPLSVAFTLTMRDQAEPHESELNSSAER
jgi:hypothetical protein